MLVANDRSVTDRLSAILAEGRAHTKTILFIKTIDEDYQLELGARSFKAADKTPAWQLDRNFKHLRGARSRVPMKCAPNLAAPSDTA